MRFWFEFFRDKRFAWDFKLANFIMGDMLRSYLELYRVALEGVIKYGNLPDWHTAELNEVLSSLQTLMAGTERK